MPFSITDLTHKDETAEKIPTKGKGLGGYASILFFPITIWQSSRNGMKTIEDLREARMLGAERELAEREEEREREELRAKSGASRDGPGPQGPPREKKVPEVEPLDPNLERDHENPRVCDSTCGNAMKSHCPIHDRKDSSRPTSPGLLAI